MNPMTIHQHAQAAADLYRKLIIAARDYPYRDFKDTRVEFFETWVHKPNDPLTAMELVEAELDILGGTGKLPNLFPAGHPRC